MPEPASLNGEVCPFCGSAQPVTRPADEILDHPLRKLCGCDGMVRALETLHDITAVETQLEVLREEAQRRRIREEKQLEASGARLQSSTFTSFDPGGFEEAYTTALNYCETFEGNHGEGLVFTGSVGTGKTHLAGAVANAIMQDRKIPVRFYSSTDMIDAIKATYGDRHVRTDDLKQILFAAPLLIIDDLGRELDTEHNRGIMYQIVNHRYENYAPIIITTNLDPEELYTRYGEAIFSRLVEMNQFIRMEGIDHRLLGHLS